jgi:DNA polymerase-3 subunit delta'
LELLEAAIAVNDHVAERLDLLLRRGRVGHAYLFSGPKGLGKRDAALNFARRWIPSCKGCLACGDCDQLARNRHPHLLQVAPAEGKVKIGIDQIHDLEHTLLLRPELPLPRVAVIDPADALTPDAMNAALKLLEEPPKGVTLILITSNAEAILPTIRSRCHPVRFYPATDEEIRRKLREISPMVPADVDLAAALCEGSFGEAQRLAGRIETLGPFVRDLLQAARASDFSRIIETIVKGKDAADTRERTRLALRVLELAFRDALRGRAGPFGAPAGSPDRWLKGIDALLEHERTIDLNAHTGLALSDALLQVTP